MRVTNMLRNMLKEPQDYACELLSIFGDAATALTNFNEARNADDGLIRNMPQQWCIDVASYLGDAGAHLGWDD